MSIKAQRLSSDALISVLTGGKYQKVEVDKIIVGDRFRKELGDVDMLVQSIQQIGLLHPIVLNEKYELVAGFRRLAACKKLEWTTISANIIDIKQLIEGEFHENFVRKDFTVSEVVAIKQAIERTRVAHRPYKDQSKNKNKVGKLPTFSSGNSRDLASKATGYSPRSINKAEAVIDYAKKHLHMKEVVDRMDTGRLSIDEAYNKVKRATHREVMVTAAGNVKLPNNCKIYNLDFRKADGKMLQKDSLDLIFADPPYIEEYIPIYGDLAEFAMKYLKSGGSCVVYAGHMHLNKILPLMEKAGLKYWWIIALKHAGNSASVHSRQVFVRWKPILWFVKGDKPNCKEYVGDLIDTTRPPEKTLHDWQQGTEEADYIITNLTYENQLVCDTMMGSGTAGESALNTGRKFIGFETDKEHFEKAKGRIASANFSK